jgi:quercetin dioxygenase-like cupin family protein
MSHTTRIKEYFIKRGARTKVKTRKTAKERRIDAPVLALNVDAEVRRLKTEPEWESGTENGITLVKYPHMRIVLVALRKGKNMHEHKVEGPMSLFVVSGTVVLTAGKSKHRLNARDMVTLRKTIPHDVHAETDSVIMLTIMAL